MPFHPYLLLLDAVARLTTAATGPREPTSCPAWHPANAQVLWKIVDDETNQAVTKVRSWATRAHRPCAG